MNKTIEAPAGIEDPFTERPWLRSYPPGVPFDMDIPKISLAQAFEEAAGKWKDRTAILFYGRRISYRELAELVDRLAAALHGLGVRKGDRVALFLPNCPQFAIAYLGAMKLGAVVTAISALSATREVKLLLEDSQAETIVCQDLLFEFVERTGLSLKRIIVARTEDYLPGVKKFLGKSFLKALYQKMQIPAIRIPKRENTLSFEKLIENNPAVPPFIEIHPEEDPAVLAYTAGTTEEAKGVLLTHTNLLAAQHLINTFWSGSFEKEKNLREGKEVSLAILPFSHIYGQVLVLLGGLLNGQTLVVLTAPDLDDIINSIGKYKATLLAAMPGLYALLSDFEKTDRIQWKGLKLAVSVADSLSKDIAEAWEKRTGVRIHEGYGLTETGSLVCLNPSGKGMADSLGIPLPGTMAAIAHTEKAELQPFGEIGELVVRGPQVMKGYWNKEAETRRSLVEIRGKSWLKTGDLAWVDDHGYFHFYDRKKDVIPFQGRSIFAREIEEVLKTHPLIKEAAVIGIPDTQAGVTVKAVIIVRSGARGKLSEEAVISHCRERLADYKIPRLIEFRGEMPKTDAGKVSRRELREERNLI